MLLDAMTNTACLNECGLPVFLTWDDGHIVGMALDNKTVVDFMVWLETSGLFSRSEP